MEKHQHPFDDFLKEALKGHQLVPPEEAKKAFLEEASAIIPTRTGWLKWYYLPILVIFISGIVAVIYYQSIDKPNSSVPIVNENLSSASITDASTSTSIPENEPNTGRLSQPVENRTLVENKSSFVTADLPATSNAIKFEPVVTTGDVSQNPIPTTPSIQNNPVGNDTLFSKTNSSTLTLDTLPITGTGTAEPVAQQVSPVSDTTLLFSNPGNADTPKPMRTDQTPYFTAGVYYLPELMFNTLEDNKFVNNFGFDAIFYRGLVSIRTGAGISVSKGITKNAIQYNDYLGTYNKLDSITFIFNESDHNFTPNLYMSSQKVWDSETKSDSTEVIKRYTYLQIPLILGFDFWQQGIFSIGVRVGTILSILLNEKQLSGDYNPGENQVVGINGITPAHVNTNWQAIGGINASVRLRKDIYFEFEPQAKYYYQSIYEKSSNTKKPWSVGVRAAVVYKF